MNRTVLKLFEHSVQQLQNARIDHFTVVCLVTWPLNESEAGVDLAFGNLTAFLMLMKLVSC